MTPNPPAAGDLLGRWPALAEIPSRDFRFHPIPTEHAMNKERLRKMIRVLQKTPPHKFRYAVYFEKQEAYDRFHAKKGTKGSVYNCGTAACVAGHTCIVFDLHGPHAFGPSGIHEKAANCLGLTAQQARFLFLMNSSSANRAAAIARIKWLLSKGTTKGYDLTREPRTCRYKIRNDDAAESRPEFYREHGVV